MALTTNLPSDVATLQTLLQDSEERNGRKDDRIERLEKLVADFKRALFGSKSEGLHRPIRAGAGRHRDGNSCYPY